MTIATPLPPAPGGTAAFRLAVAAIEGRFLLQACRCCAQILYPPTEVCSHCLHGDLHWMDFEPTGEILAGTAVHRSIEPYFRLNAPPPIGLVRLASGATLYAFLGSDAPSHGRTAIALRLNAAGGAVFVAGVSDATSLVPGLSVRHGPDHLLDSPDPISAAGRLAAALAFHGVFHHVRHDADRSIIEAYPGGGAVSVRIRNMERVPS